VPPTPTTRCRRIAHAVATLGAAAALVVVTAACAKTTSTAAASTPTTRAPLPVDFSQPGPYKVGMATVDIGGRDAVVYYPALITPPLDPKHVESYSPLDALPASVRSSVPPGLLPPVTIDAYQNARANPEGPFPVVIHSHGEGSADLFDSLHFAQLASWGFVVAAPDHRERSIAAPVAAAAGSEPPAPDQDVTDMHDTWQALRDENVNAQGLLKGAMNLDQLAVEGDSMGVETAMKFATDPAVKTVIGEDPVLSTDLTSQPPPSRPTMLITGDADGVVSVDDVRTDYGWLAAPKALAVVHGAGHDTFSDLCPAIRTQGGLGQYQASLPPSLAGVLRLADGCLPTDLDPQRADALLNQLTIAQLRWAFQIDPDRTNLDPSFLQQTFGDALGSLESG
jgi:predicted dienelactone hydrolase